VWCFLFLLEAERKRVQRQGPEIVVLRDVQNHPGNFAPLARLFHLGATGEIKCSAVGAASKEHVGCGHQPCRG